jgi:D-alanyl-D-alanine carboxypeptidase/D-alanyl-D-alanine-endopeptidase (penicillin-binding protein 4)
MGVTVVDGDVVGDDNLFDDQVLGLGWQWDDEPYYYSAQVSALSLNGNCVDVTVAATQPGQPATVRWAPDSTGYITVTNKSVTVSGDQRGRERYYRPRASNNIEVLSEVPEGTEQSECLSIENPTLYFVYVFREILERRGVTVTGRAIDIDELVEPPIASDEERVLARHESPALSEIAAAVNKPSDNLFAELLLRTLGVERPIADSTVTPGSAWMGAEAAARTFAAASIDTSRIRLADGSGLSRMHLVTTDMTVRLLSYMWKHPDGAVRDAFVSSLPVGGVDGTLENRYDDGPARGNVQAKTGTMTSVSSLGGYVRTASGRPIAFALMCNNYTSPTSAVRAAQDRIVNLLASLP